MATRITLKNNLHTREYFYKTVSKNIVYAPMGHYVDECRLDVDINSIRDIDRLRDFLDVLEVGIKSGKVHKKK